MKHRRIFSPAAVPLLFGLILLAGCQRSQPTTTVASSPEHPAVAVPPDLQETVNTLVPAVEALDISGILSAYADDFVSGTRRNKDSVREVFARLKENHVQLQVEQTTFEKVAETEARLRTQLRLRYNDRFRDLGEGEVVVTDVLRHFFRKEESGWKIYTDERISTYREGRFGQQPPNAQLEVPDHLPTNLEYPVTVTVPRERDMDYQVMVGNYAEDPAILPPPDIMTTLPDDGVLRAHLLPNPQGRSEMVRITIIAAAPDGQWVGATTISKFVPSATPPKTPEDAEEEQELI